jgi:hypothetical protein
VSGVVELGMATVIESEDDLDSAACSTAVTIERGVAMRHRNTGLLAAVVMLVACSTETTTVLSTCTPGQAIACAGAGGCSGSQVCKADGTYDVCTCGPASDATAGDTDSPDTGTVDSATTDGTSSDTAVADVPADTAVAPITPDMLTGLSLWLDGDKGVTSAVDPAAPTSPTLFVSLWKDQSGQGNDAKSPSSVSQQPTQNKSAFKGHDAVRFNYNCGYITVADDATLQVGTGAFAVIVVASYQKGYQGNTLFSKDPNDPGGAVTGLRIDVTGAPGADAKIGALAPSADAYDSVGSGFHAVIVRGPALDLRIDGVPIKGKTTTADLSGVGTPLRIGGFVVPTMSGGSVDCGVTDIVEYAVVKGGVTDAQVAGVEAYLKGKYKFGW